MCSHLHPLNKGKKSQCKFKTKYYEWNTLLSIVLSHYSDPFFTSMLTFNSFYNITSSTTHLVSAMLVNKIYLSNRYVWSAKKTMALTLKPSLGFPAQAQISQKAFFTLDIRTCPPFKEACEDPVPAQQLLFGKTFQPPVHNTSFSFPNLTENTQFLKVNTLDVQNTSKTIPRQPFLCSNPATCYRTYLCTPFNHVLKIIYWTKVWHVIWVQL